MNYTRREMMAIAAGRLIRDGDVVFAGTGLPLLAATVAKKVHAPRCVIFFETGAIDSPLPELPLYVADSRVMYGASVNAGLLEAFSILSNPKVRSIALLGAAQVDRYGNLNSTCVGDYHRPRVRFPGSGGACDGASLAWGFIVFVPHERRRFVEKLDYLTSPGWLSGGDSRRRAGLPRGGPIAVVTDLGVLRFDEQTKEMYLAEYYPGVKLEEVQANTGFELDVSRAVEAEPPSSEELRVLREEVDPQRLILGG
ncbi:MAG: ketoacid-CoA transferase [Thermoprotei archaeon]|nr:MAG: ketoacid-CoA transferase [Thermoprotei archaeon]